MRAIVVLSATACAAFATAAAAQPRAPPCPKVEAIGPTTASGKEPMTFTAMVSGGDPAVDPTYNWTVSAGTIESGQGTSTITVNGEGATFVTATADVGGYDRACPTAASTSVSVEG